MLLGPIFQVELVSTARRGRYFGLRVLYGLLILLVLWSCHEQVKAFSRFSNTQMSTRHASELASTFFIGFSWLQMLAVLAVGPAMAVGTISSERERRTIEYLFVTDLSNTEIIIGKAFARLLLIGKLLLVGLPILFIFRLLGGIPVGALLATYLLAGSAALMVTSLSIAISVWSTRSRDATMRIYLLLVALLFLPLMISPITGLLAGQSNFVHHFLAPLNAALLVVNPIFSLGVALGNRFATGLGLDMATVWWTVLWQTVVSVGALVSATLAVRRVHLADSSRGVSKKSRRGSFKMPQWKPRMGNRPMVWKEMFAGTAKTKLGLVGVAASALILASVLGTTVVVFLEAIDYGANIRNDDFLQYLTMMNGLMGSGILLLLASRAAGLVTNEIERDCWLSILATPLSGQEIMLGKMWGNLYSVRWALLVLIVVWSFHLWIDPNFFLAMIFMAVAFLVLAWYATNLGLTYSLRSKTTLRSIGFTLGTFIFLGGGYMLCCCSVMFSGGGGSEIMLAPCIPFLLAIPTMAYHDFFGLSGSSGMDDEMYIVYVFGMGGYLVAALLLSVMITSRFDEFSGRCIGAEGIRPPRRLPSEGKPPSDTPSQSE